ncbi:hypothetical protein BRADI_1g43046v3, partial [Brachypodium distachyon]
HVAWDRSSLSLARAQDRGIETRRQQRGNLAATSSADGSRGLLACRDCSPSRRSRVVPSRLIMLQWSCSAAPGSGFAHGPAGAAGSSRRWQPPLPDSINSKATS